MQQEKLKKNKMAENDSFTIIPDYFFRKLIKVMGAIPSLVYLNLLSYCHKKSYIAWPSLNTISQEIGIAKTTTIRNLNILIKQNFVKNITGDTSCENCYQHNVYQLLPPEEILFSLSPDQEKDTTVGSVALPQRVGNTSISDSAMIPSGFQNATGGGSDTIPQVVAERYPNNNNLNNNNITTTRDVVVNFKKIKEKGEEKMEALRERMKEFDFTESFIEKVLKEYPLKKVEEKLELYAGGKVVRNPVGWLMAALKEDYGKEGQGRRPGESVETNPEQLRMDSRLRGNNLKDSENDIEKSGNKDKKILSREEAIKRIQGIRKNLRAVNQ